MRPISLLLLGLCAPGIATAAQAQAATPDHDAKVTDAKVTLRYRFEPGETLRWEVTHRNRTRTTVSGTTQSAETTSVSVKVWEVKQVEPDGTATFVHSVEDVDMWQKMTDQTEVRYDSREEGKPPRGFEHVAQSVGVPLATVTMDPRGRVLERERHKAKAAAKSKGPVAVPLPEGPVAVGARWSKTEEIRVRPNMGSFRTIKARQTFELESIATGVATIRGSTLILTPIDDPAVEWQVVQHEKSGSVRFDVDAGRILSQHLEVDRRVVGFRGETSSLHYATEFVEELLPDAAATASRAAALRR